VAAKPKPKYFLDTSVCIGVSRGKIRADEWQRVSKEAQKQYRYWISPLTAYELVAGLATGEDKYYLQNRRAIEVLYASGQGRFLPQLREFMPKVLFGETAVIPSAAKPDLDVWVRAVLRAPNRQTLESGSMRMQIKGKWRSFGLDLDDVNKQMRDIQKGYTSHFGTFRREKVPELTPQVWASMILTSLAKPETPDNERLVLERLDAAYRFDRVLFDFSVDPNYDFSKHGPEIVDAQQLYYLCDPEMFFVTSEKKLVNKLASSPQISQILTYEQFRDRVCP
jgi:hypothetical protein